MFNFIKKGDNNFDTTNRSIPSVSRTNKTSLPPTPKTNLYSQQYSNSVEQKQDLTKIEEKPAPVVDKVVKEVVDDLSFLYVERKAKINSVISNIKQDEVVDNKTPIISSTPINVSSESAKINMQPVFIAEHSNINEDIKSLLDNDFFKDEVFKDYDFSKFDSKKNDNDNDDDDTQNFRDKKKELRDQAKDGLSSDVVDVINSESSTMEEVIEKLQKRGLSKERALQMVKLKGIGSKGSTRGI